MATLDISSALNAMVTANTPQAQMERNLGLAMFASRVDDVNAAARRDLAQLGVDLKKLIANDEIDEDIALILLESAKNSLDVTDRFKSRYFNG